MVVPEPEVAPEPEVPEPDQSEPVASTDTFLGYDARQLWDECSAQGVAEYPEAQVIVDYDLWYFDQWPDGRPVVYVAWDQPEHPMPTGVIWICAFGGDPSAPDLQVFNAKDS